MTSCPKNSTPLPKKHLQVNLILFRPRNCEWSQVLRYEGLLLTNKAGCGEAVCTQIAKNLCHFSNPPPLRIGFTYTFHQNVPGNGSHGIQMIRSKASLHTMGTLSQPGCAFNSPVVWWSTKLHFHGAKYLVKTSNGLKIPACRCSLE